MKCSLQLYTKCRCKCAYNIHVERHIFHKEMKKNISIVRFGIENETIGIKQNIPNENKPNKWKQNNGKSYKQNEEGREYKMKKNTTVHMMENKNLTSKLKIEERKKNTWKNSWFSFVLFHTYMQLMTGEININCSNMCCRREKQAFLAFAICWCDYNRLFQLPYQSIYPQFIDWLGNF